MNLYLETLTRLQDQYEKEKSPAKRFHLLSLMAATLDDVVFAVKESLRGSSS